jgi:hypothetical protein
MNSPIRLPPVISSSTKRSRREPSQMLRLTRNGVPCGSPRHLHAHRTINFRGSRSGAPKSSDQYSIFLGGVQLGASRSPGHHYRLVHGIWTWLEALFLPQLDLRMERNRACYCYDGAVGRCRRMAQAIVGGDGCS